MLYVFSQSSPQNGDSFAEHNLRKFTESAQLAGCKVIHLPTDWEDCSPADALCYFEPHDNDMEARGVFAGYINFNSYYEQLFYALLLKNVRLVNRPKASERAMEFELFYPRITDLTPASVIVRSEDELEGAAATLGFPMFVKGGIKSDKEGGWKACVVDTLDELRERFAWCAARPITARSTMIAREIAPLRKSGKIVGGFPESREYRTFLYKGQLIGMGYYWADHDPFGALDESDRAQVEALARLTSERVDCPLMAVDIGQLENGKWIVVETGDLQYSGVSQMPHLEFWTKLGAMLGT
jgi:hypothetical protein